MLLLKSWVYAMIWNILWPPVLAFFWWKVVLWIHSSCLRILSDEWGVTKCGVFILKNLAGYGANVRLYGDVRVYWDWKGVTTRTSAVCSVSSFPWRFNCPPSEARTSAAAASHAGSGDVCSCCRMSSEERTSTECE